MSSRQNRASLGDAIELGRNHLHDTISDVVDPKSVTQDGNVYSRPLASTADQDTFQSTYHQHQTSNWVQKITMGLVALLFAMLAVLIAVASATYDKVNNYETKVVTVYDSVGLPGYEGYSWTDVLSAATGQTVNFYTYSDASYNAWIDDWLSPRMESIYGVTINRVPLTDTADAINKIFHEYAVGLGNNNTGSIDLIWINGENFAKLKSAGYAYGPWATKVPNAANFNFSSPSIAYDFGTPTQGFEIPYNGAQVIFVYNNDSVQESSISDISKLMSWIKQNPGKFTYAAPCANADCSNYDYTGSVFIRHIFYYIGSPYSQFLGAFNEAKYLLVAPSFYAKLRELEPYLYNNSLYLGGHYPSSNNDVDVLFGVGNVSVTLSYDVGQATNQIAQDQWPSSTMATVLTSGTIANTNFLLIPGDAEHKLAAVVTGNYVASAQAMFSRAQPETLAAQQVYSSSSSNFNGGGWNDAFAYIDRPSTTPSQATLTQYAMAELSPAYINRIQQDWYICVLQYSQPNRPSYCG